MASVTLAESAKLSQDELVSGIIEDVITVDRFFEVLPFDGIEGNALAYNRENVLGAADVAGVGTDLSANAGATYKAPATFTQVTASLTKIIGDAEVDNLIQATRSDHNDQTAVQVASKAKTVGRKYRDMLINGTGVSNQFLGLDGLCAAAQEVDTGTNGSNLSFELLDELIDLVTDKDGQVDFLIMHQRTIRSYKALLRALNGASINEVLELPSGARVPHYNGIPIFANNYVATNVSAPGGTLNTTSVYAGTLDDGSRTHGIAGLTARNEAGMSVIPVGQKENADETIFRVRWYCGLACFSEKGLAKMPFVRN